jgi:hypothetical protein
MSEIKSEVKPEIKHNVDKKSGFIGRKNQGNRYMGQIAPKSTKFEGKTEALKGHIYDCSDSRQSDQFARTTKEIAEYLGRTARKHGGDIRVTVTNLTVCNIEMPMDLPTVPTPTPLENKIWEEKVKKYVERESCLAENVKMLFAIVIGQCTEIMIAKLEAISDYSTIVEEGDGVALLKAIKDMTLTSRAKNIYHMPYMNQLGTSTFANKELT